jgi:hypothetical protein
MKKTRQDFCYVIFLTLFISIIPHGGIFSKWISVYFLQKYGKSFLKEKELGKFSHVTAKFRFIRPFVRPSTTVGKRNDRKPENGFRSSENSGAGLHISSRSP